MPKPQQAFAYETSCPPLTEARMLAKLLASGETISGIRALIGDGHDNVYRRKVRIYFEYLVSAKPPKDGVRPHEGSTAKYTAGCRCPGCSRAKRVYNKNYRCKKQETHGRRSCYNDGCGCAPCCDANDRHNREYRKKVGTSDQGKQLAVQSVAA
jgi:hypothetical protein